MIFEFRNFGSRYCIQEFDYRILGSSFFLGSRNTQIFFEKVNSIILLRKLA